MPVNSSFRAGLWLLASVMLTGSSYADQERAVVWMAAVCADCRFEVSGGACTLISERRRSVY